LQRVLARVGGGNGSSLGFGEKVSRCYRGSRRRLLSVIIWRCHYNHRFSFGSRLQRFGFRLDQKVDIRVEGYLLRRQHFGEPDACVSAARLLARREAK